MTSDTSTQKETPAEHFSRSLHVTAASRFFAAKRFRSHESWSLCAISFASLLLIFIPLFKPFELSVYLSDGIVNLVQVLSASVILVFSLLVNGSKYGERAEMMHSCGLGINSISRKLEYSMHTGSAEQDLPELRLAYENLLEKHENHSELDFLCAKIRKFPSYYKITWKEEAEARILKWLSYSHYAFIVLLQLVFIWLMLVSPQSDPFFHALRSTPAVVNQAAPPLR